MSGSTDSLKKKVCVTVFLDELFEEVEEEERRDPKQVSEVSESVGRMAENPFSEPSPVDLDNDERVNLSPNADTEQNQIQVRPRKHRRESKFSKNRYDSFKNELTKYGYGSMKVENEGREPVDSAFSDSDFDLDEFLGLEKWTLDKSVSSFAELSDGDLTGESFLSVRPLLSIARMTSRSRRHNQQLQTVSYCNKSTQFEIERKESAKENKKKAKVESQFDLLQSLLEKCVSSKGEQTKPGTNESHTLSGEESPPEVKKVWTRGVIWNDGLESELSEADCDHPPKDKESIVCCTPEGESSQKEEPLPVVIPSPVGEECELVEGTDPVGETQSKNFTEGDTIEEPLIVSNPEGSENSSETKVILNEIIVNRAEIELHPKEDAQEEAETTTPQTAVVSDVEVFFNQKRSRILENSMTDMESEMVFAESENYGDSEEFFCSGFSLGPAPSPAYQGDICVLEFEDKLSRTKILRRMKTVEILGDTSFKDMQNISTEVILICENISSNDVCLEAWQSSASTLRSISEMKQCYLKDSTDSAMYLIEVPLHFKKERPSEHFFQPSESD